MGYIGEGNSNLCQYSFLENPRDRGAWWATVHGVTRVDTTEWLNHRYQALYVKFFPASVLLLSHIFTEAQRMLKQHVKNLTFYWEMDLVFNYESVNLNSSMGIFPLDLGPRRVSGRKYVLKIDICWVDPQETLCILQELQTRKSEKQENWGFQKWVIYTVIMHTPTQRESLGNLLGPNSLRADTCISPQATCHGQFLTLILF